nr:zinc finger, CCHC-type [Tanacetum cinerariifolium]
MTRDLFLVRVDQERIVKRVPTSSHRVLLLQSRAMQLQLHKLFQLAYDVHTCRMIPRLVIILEGDMCTFGTLFVYMHFPGGSLNRFWCYNVDFVKGLKFVARLECFLSETMLMISSLSSIATSRPPLERGCSTNQRLSRSATIFVLKTKIGREVRIPVEEQALIFDEHLLEGDLITLANFGINRGSTLTLVHKSRGLVPIFIKFAHCCCCGISHPRHTFKVKLSDTINNVKTKIRAKVGDEGKVLIFNETVLEDSSHVSDFDIKNGSTLTILPKSTGRMQIFVYGRKKLPLEVKHSDTILYVKAKIHDIEGIPTSEQILLWEGWRLEFYSSSFESTLKPLYSGQVDNSGNQKVRMKALLEQQGLAAALKELPAATIVAYDKIMDSGGSYHITYMRDYLVDFGRECHVRGIGTLEKEGFYREDAVRQDQGYKGFIGACDMEQHSAHELFRYKEDSNEAAFAVAAVEKIYAHDSLTFNYTVTCEVISKWKVGLKEDMDARSNVYVLSNDVMIFSCGCKAKIWVINGLLDEAKGNILGMEIFRIQSVNTLHVSQSRVYNGKLVQTLLEGHSILSLEGSLSGDCDVEKNDVGMLDGFDRGLKTNVHVLWILTTPCVDQSQAYMALTEAIWLKGLAIESEFELKIVASIATGALSKAILGPRFQHRLNLLSIGTG